MNGLVSKGRGRKCISGKTSRIMAIIVLLRLFGLSDHINAAICDESLGGSSFERSLSMIAKNEIRVQATENNFMPDRINNRSYIRLLQGSSVLAHLNLAYGGPQRLLISVEMMDSHDRRFVQVSLLKALLGRLNYYGIDTDVDLVSDETLDRDALELFGFQKESSGFKLKVIASEANKLAAFKRDLKRAQAQNQSYGRGFSFDLSNVDRGALELLMSEYNDLAWGRTSWAMHGQVAPDELRLIEALANKHERVLEVGAGAGRLTPTLAKNFKEVVATDYLESIVKQLEGNMAKESLQNVWFKVHDILSPDLLNGKYDKIFFLENGLGGILNFKDREKAIYQMARHLKMGGSLVLGLRTFADTSMDHVMPASQDPIFFGIYHTFSVSEIKSLAPNELSIEQIIEGETRPAGGHALFVVMKKEKEM